MAATNSFGREFVCPSDAPHGAEAAGLMALCGAPPAPGPAPRPLATVQTADHTHSSRPNGPSPSAWRRAASMSTKAKPKGPKLKPNRPSPRYSSDSDDVHDDDSEPRGPRPKLKPKPSRPHLVEAVSAGPPLSSARGCSPTARGGSSSFSGGGGPSMKGKSAPIKTRRPSAAPVLVPKTPRELALAEATRCLKAAKALPAADAANSPGTAASAAPPVLRFMLGNSAVPCTDPPSVGALVAPAAEGSTTMHEWTVYLRDAAVADGAALDANSSVPALSALKEVQFFLHDSFDPATVTVTAADMAAEAEKQQEKEGAVAGVWQRGYNVKRKGWGVFELAIKLFGRHGWTTTLKHMLVLRQQAAATAIPVRTQTTALGEAVAAGRGISDGRSGGGAAAAAAAASPKVAVFATVARAQKVIEVEAATGRLIRRVEPPSEPMRRSGRAPKRQRPREAPGESPRERGQGALPQPATSNLGAKAAQRIAVERLATKKATVATTEIDVSNMWPGQRLELKWSSDVGGDDTWFAAEVVALRTVSVIYSTTFSLAPYLWLTRSLAATSRKYLSYPTAGWLR